MDNNTTFIDGDFNDSYESQVRRSTGKKLKKQDIPTKKEFEMDFNFIDEDYLEGFTAGVQSQEDIAIKFAEWIAVRYYSMHQSSNTWFDGEYRVGSTEKLFEIFKQENK